MTGTEILKLNTTRQYHLDFVCHRFIQSFLNYLRLSFPKKNFTFSVVASFYFKL